MRPLLVSMSDSGGAGNAALRLHQALVDSGVDSRMAVRRKYSDSEAVMEFRHAGSRALLPLRTRGQQVIQLLQRTPNPVLHSSNVLPSRWLSRVPGDIVNLHWVGAGALTIEEIGRIDRPTVMTLHDMWGFCGSEHYASEAPDARWAVGYERTNRPARHTGLDLDRITWLRKRRSWRPMTIVSPSRWLDSCVDRSALMSDWPHIVIPNALDTRTFRPLDRQLARRMWKLPEQAKIVLFGAIDGATDLRKGFDLLLGALRCIRRQDNVLAVVFGQDQPAPVPDFGVRSRWVGYVHDDSRLAALYNAADVMVVPSRQEVLPQTATEAQACGTPVVAFRTGGLPDAVEHSVTGYLANPFISEDLAAGISLILEGGENFDMRMAARARAERLWDPAAVAAAYSAVYEAALTSWTSRVN